MSVNQVAQRHLRSNKSFNEKAYALLGSTVVAEPLPGKFTQIASAQGLTNQQLTTIMVYLPIDITVLGVQWYQSTAGAYTANNYNGWGCYSLSGGSMTLVGSSTTDGNIWKATSNTWNQKAFSSPIALTEGIYILTPHYCRSAETTQPLIGGFAAMQQSGVTVYNFANSVKISSTLLLQTSLPTPQAFSGMSNTASMWYGALYS